MSTPSRKPRTRGNRDGRPYQRSSDNKWVATVYLPNGKRKPVYGDSRKEVLEKKKKAEEEIAAGQPLTAGRTDSLQHYLERVWLATTLPQRVAAGRLSQGTLDSYGDTVDKHIVPHIGRVKLVDLAPHHLRTWLMELQAKPSGRQRKKLRPGETELPPPVLLSPRTVAYAHAVLRAALTDALRDELVKRNVATLVEPPASDRKKARVLTKEEAAALLSAAADDRLWAYWIVVLALGLRRGEGLGMRWSHIDFAEGTVRLEKSVQRVRGAKDPETGRRKGQLVEKDLKTQASTATVALPATALEALKEHRKQQAAEQLEAKVWADPDLVFTTGIGTALEPRNVSRSWDAVCTRAGVKARIHDLRHACASFLFAEGADIKTIQGVLRHSRQSTTSDVYVHFLQEVRAGAADTMDAVLVDLASRRRSVS